MPPREPIRPCPIRRLDGRDPFKHPVGFGEGTQTWFTSLVSVGDHLASLRSIEEIVDIADVAAQQCTSEDHRAIRAGRQRSWRRYRQVDIDEYEIGSERAERGQSLLRGRGNLDLVPFIPQDAGK